MNSTITKLNIKALGDPPSSGSHTLRVRLVGDRRDQLTAIEFAGLNECQREHDILAWQLEHGADSVTLAVPADATIYPAD